MCKPLSYLAFLTIYTTRLYTQFVSLHYQFKNINSPNYRHSASFDVTTEGDNMIMEGVTRDLSLQLL